MRNVTVVVDAGHGGKDPGAVYEPLIKPGASYYEKQITLPIALHLAGYIAGYDGDDISYKLLMTRSSDKKVSTTRRIWTANAFRADAFVSCHINDVRVQVDPEKVLGASVLYFRTSETAFDLADHILAEILKTGLLKRFSDGLMPSGVDILRKTRMPAVIAELGFIRNYQDLQVITDEDNQAKLAYAIFKGLHFWMKKTGGQAAS